VKANKKGEAERKEKKEQEEEKSMKEIENKGRRNGIRRRMQNLKKETGMNEVKEKKD
jgi:hypothetical protein